MRTIDAVQAPDGAFCNLFSTGRCGNGTCVVSSCVKWITQWKQSVNKHLFVQHIGCDNIIGSNKTLDACGVCGGDNSSCYEFEDVIVYSSDEDYDGLYHTLEIRDVIEIPKRAARIRISEELSPFLNDVNFGSKSIYLYIVSSTVLLLT